jgi:hypothetical protein
VGVDREGDRAIIQREHDIFDSPPSTEWMHFRIAVRARGFGVEEFVKAAEWSLVGALFALGCAMSPPAVEPRATRPDATLSSDVDSIDAPVGHSRAADHRAEIENSPTADRLSPIYQPPSIDQPPPIAIPKIRLPIFGAVTTDAEGKLVVLPADEIRNAENAMYGWLIWVGPSANPVQWTETLDAPAGFESTSGSNAVIPDGSFEALEGSRRVTFTNAMVPDHGFIFSQWALGADEAPGRYEITVSLPDDRTERFSFALGPAQDACPAMKVLINWWGAKHSLRGDPGKRDVSDRVLNVFGTRLARHGFVTAALEDAYWYVMASAARRSDDREVAYGHIVMRAISDFQGKARRYSSTTNFTGRIDYGVLFDSPVGRLDEFTRTLADQFAAILSPHARQSCSDWWGGQLEEEARLEEVRIQLEAEILRVRERRAEQEKRLELDVEPWAGQSDQP